MLARRLRFFSRPCCCRVNTYACTRTVRARTGGYKQCHLLSVCMHHVDGDPLFPSSMEAAWVVLIGISMLRLLMLVGKYCTLGPVRSATLTKHTSTGRMAVESLSVERIHPRPTPDPHDHGLFRSFITFIHHVHSAAQKHSTARPPGDIASNNRMTICVCSGLGGCVDSDVTSLFLIPCGQTSCGLQRPGYPWYGAGHPMARMNAGWQ